MSIMHWLSRLQGRWRVWLLLFLLTGCLALPSVVSASRADAAHHGLTVTARAGFGSERFSKNNFWIPVYIQVDNEGTAITGQVEAAFDNGNQHSVAAVNTTLGTHSNKSFVLYGVFSTAYNFSINIRVMDQGQAVYNEQLDTSGISPLQTGDELLGILSDNPLPFSFLANIQTSLSGTLHTSSITLDDLPTQPLALRNLDGLVISDATLSSIRPQQQQALATWVHMGGLLIVTGGSVPAQQTIQNLPAGLLPVTITGSKTVAHLPVLEKFLEHRLPGSGPYVVSTVKQISGDSGDSVDSVVREGEIPLLVHATRGGGTVFFLGLDPAQNPLNGWADGNDRLWRYLLDYLPQTPVTRVSQINPSTGDSIFLQAVNNIPATALPSAPALVILLIFYVLTVTFANYIVLRLFDKRELAWITIPVIALAFTGLSFFLGFRAKGANIIINQISIIHASPGSSSAPETTYLGIFSPNKTTYRISIGRDALISTSQDRLNFVNPTLGNGSLYWLQGNPTVLPDFAMDFSTLATLRADSVIELRGQVSGVLTVQNKQVVGQLTNNTGFRLTGAYLLLGHANTSLGDFAPGESKAVVLYPGTSNDFFYSASSGPLGRSKDMILNSLYGSGTADLSSTNQVTFVGWMEDNAVTVKVKGYNPAQQALTLYTSSVPLSFATSKGIVTIPQELILANQEGSTASSPGLSGNQPGSYFVYPAQNFVIAYQLPVSTAMLAHPTLDITVGANVVNGVPSKLDPVELLLWNWKTSSWTPKKIPKGAPISISAAGSFISPSGHIRVRYINDQKSTVNLNPLTLSVHAEVPQ